VLPDKPDSQRTKKEARLFKKTGLFSSYEAGGRGSSLIATTSSGFLRSVTNPTTMGMAMNIMERHRKTYPTEGGIGWSVSNNEYEPLPVIVPMPITHAKRLQHPHKNAVTTVAIMPVVFLSIYVLLQANNGYMFLVYWRTKTGCKSRQS
jgi:hypothetical protein